MQDLLKVDYQNQPFKDNNTNTNCVYRFFSEDVNKSSLKWHRDPEDRIIKSTTHTDWKVQLEDQLPQDVSKEIFIPRLYWHRLIKGTNNLTLKLNKL